MVLSSRMPELGALQLLLAVAHTGSVNSAARELGVSQQAASARMTSLESVIGVPLVRRTSKGSALTPAGRVVSGWAARLIEVAEEVDAGLATLRDDRRTRLAVSASLTVAEHLLPGWLVSLQAESRRTGRPAMEVVLNATNSEHVLEQVLDGAADVGFIESPGALRGLRSRVVAHDELVLVVSPDHPWARRTRPVPALELLATPLVSREEGSGTRTALARALDRACDGPPQLSPVMALSTTSAVRAAVRAGAGAAVLSQLSVADDLAFGRLRQVPTADLDLARDLRAVWVGGPQPPPGAGRDLITHAASARPPAG